MWCDRFSNLSAPVQLAYEFPPIDLVGGKGSARSVVCGGLHHVITWIDLLAVSLIGKFPG